MDESGLRMLLYADRLQPLAVNEVPDPDDFFPICKDVAHIDGQCWGIPHWTCTNYMFYNKNDKELAGVETFSELENVIGGKNHPRGQGLLVDMMDPGMGRNPQNDKIFDYLQRQFMYGNGRAVQPGYVDSFCLDKSLKGQKRADAIKYITWVTSREVVVKQIAPTPDFVRYLSPARLSIYVDPNLLNQAPLYEQLQPIMKLARYYPPPADWDWAPGLEAKLEKILPTN